MLSDAVLRQWFIDRFDCLYCLDSGIIFHRDDTDEPCDKCEKFNQRLEQDRAQLPEQAAGNPEHKLKLKRN